MTALALDRIAAYDRHTIGLNSCPVLDPDALENARASDVKRKDGRANLLEGIPYTTKDSYSVKGLTCANGSPAFVNVVASRDAFVIEKLRQAGAVLLARTNMVCLAGVFLNDFVRGCLTGKSLAGGMQRGVYGRAESPYNPDYLAAAFASGSSNGSGVFVQCTVRYLF